MGGYHEGLSKKVELYLFVMKKLLYAVLILLGLGIMGVSCSKVGSVSMDDYATAIVGRWSAYKAVGQNGEVSTLTGHDDELILVFTETGQFVMEEGDDAGKGTYWVEGKSLFMRYWGETTQYTISKLTSKELVLTIDNGDISSMYFKRIE